jgi:PPOX class probable F420-dependent enzyme
MVDEPPGAVVNWGSMLPPMAVGEGGLEVSPGLGPDSPTRWGKDANVNLEGAVDSAPVSDLLDINTEFGARTEQRLREDTIGWLVTVGKDGTPHPNPVWFLWDGQSLLIYSAPGQAKLKNIERNPNVAFHLDSRSNGDDVVIITGEAHLDPAAPTVDRNPPYVDKYQEEIKRIGLFSAEAMALTYSVAIRLTPRRVRGF